MIINIESSTYAEEKFTKIRLLSVNVKNLNLEKLRLTSMKTDHSYASPCRRSKHHSH